MNDTFVKLLQRAIQKDASDIHLKTDSAPYFRVDGEMQRQSEEIIDQEQMDGIVRQMLSDEQLKHFLRKGEIDLSYSQKGVGRFRVNMFRQRGTISLVMRRIKTRILDFGQLHLPHSVERFAMMSRGLILITGALFTLALTNVVTKKISTISGVAFTASFFALFQVSEILNRRRALTLEQAYKLHQEWHIPADILIQPYRTNTATGRQ